ncbi:hypothetical protein BTVI_99822 [Pitangus sulphuratus]|nr:hypothetical protein BTVI_99822 [Pitangus sulphuratus]
MGLPLPAGLSITYLDDHIHHIFSRGVAVVPAHPLLPSDTWCLSGYIFEHQRSKHYEKENFSTLEKCEKSSLYIEECSKAIKGN